MANLASGSKAHEFIEAGLFYDVRGVGVRLHGLFSVVALVAFAIFCVQDLVRLAPMAKHDGEQIAGADRAASHGSADLVGDSSYAISGYGGVAYSHDSDVRLRRGANTDFTVEDVSWVGKPFQNPIYYGVRFTRWLANSPIGLMLDGTHAKAIAKREETRDVSGVRDGEALPPKSVIDKLYQRLEFSHGHNMVFLTGLFRLPFGTENLRPYVGLGAGFSIPHVEIDEVGIDGRTYEYQIAGAAFQLLGGVEAKLPNASLFIEYKFTFSPYRAMLTHAPAGDDGAVNELTTDLATHHLIGGVTRYFSRSPAQ